MGFEIKDLAGLSGPLKKCVEVISNGIGTLYRPKAMRDAADAKAYEILAIAKAEADAGVLAVEGKAKARLEYIKTLTDGNPEIYDRARARLIAREVEGQHNVEAIAENALQSLPENVSDDPVSDDWRRKFFLEAENICDADMQELWGRVLAGEVAKPGSFSLRTLNVLKSLSREEAELFRLACSLANDTGEIIVQRTKRHLLGDYGLHYGRLMTLADAGLLHSPSFVLHSFRDYPDEAFQAGVYLTNNGLHFLLSGPLLKNVDLHVLTFTAVGKELQKLIPPNPCMPYIRDVAKFLRAHHGLTLKMAIETKQDDGSTAIAFAEEF